MAEKLDFVHQHSEHKAQFAHHAVNLAYKVNSSIKYAQAVSDVSLMHQDWDVLCKSSDDVDVKQYGYKSVAFINRHTQEIHVATAGTKIKELDDLFDDCRLSFGQTPKKMKPMQQFIDKIVQELGGKENASMYDFSTSGHSLGAVISDLTGVELLSRGFNFNKSVTFDSPGSRDVIKNALEHDLFTGKMTKTVDELAQYCEEYNAKPNFINTVNTHTASTTHLVIPASKDKLQTIETKSSGIWGFGKYLCNKVGAAVTKCSETLGIKSVVDQIADHKMSSFDRLNDAAIFKTEEALPINGQLTLKEQELGRLKNLASTGSDVCIFTEEIVDNMISLDIHEYSFNDLSRAQENSTLMADHILDDFVIF